MFEDHEELKPEVSKKCVYFEKCHTALSASCVYGCCKKCCKNKCNCTLSKCTTCGKRAVPNIYGIITYPKCAVHQRRRRILKLPY